MSPWKVIGLLLVCSACCVAEPFVRTETDASGSRLQTRITQYTHPGGAKVTLIAAIHVAEPEYFRQLVEIMRPVDAVVYEGILRTQSAPQFHHPFASNLDLVEQRQAVALKPERCERGDLTDVEFDRARDPAPVPNPPATRAELAHGVMRYETDSETRRLTESAFAIRARNTAAITALRHRLARGEKRVALLYGAAHAQDLSQRLRNDLGFTVESQQWVTAFTFRDGE